MHMTVDLKFVREKIVGRISMIIVLCDDELADIHIMTLDFKFRHILDIYQ